MRIGELAHALNVSPDTVRFYERSSLLPRHARAENGYRVSKPPPGPRHYRGATCSVASAPSTSPAKLENSSRGAST
jgi:hypothetical protein